MLGIGRRGDIFIYIACSKKLLNFYKLWLSFFFLLWLQFIWKLFLSKCLCFLQNSYVEILITFVMVFDSGDFGKWLGRKGEALLNWLGVLEKRP